MNLTEEQILQVREWRKSHNSYRMIAELFAKKYPEFGIKSGNQIDGKEL